MAATDLCIRCCVLCSFMDCFPHSVISIGPGSNTCPTPFASLFSIHLQNLRVDTALELNEGESHIIISIPCRISSQNIRGNVPLPSFTAAPHSVGWYTVVRLRKPQDIRRILTRSVKDTLQRISASGRTTFVEDIPIVQAGNAVGFT